MKYKYHNKLDEIVVCDDAAYSDGVVVLTGVSRR